MGRSSFLLRHRHNPLLVAVVDLPRLLLNSRVIGEFFVIVTIP